MSWRTVVISSRCKLDLKMGYMVVRGEEVSRVYLDEIAILLIENPAVAMTGCLLSELVERKIKVIFCDSKRTPQAVSWHPTTGAMIPPAKSVCRWHGQSRLWVLCGEKS